MNKTKVALIALVAVTMLSLPLTVEGARNTFIGMSCDNIQRNSPAFFIGVTAICNDINELNDRLSVLESAGN